MADNKTTFPLSNERSSLASRMPQAAEQTTGSPRGGNMPGMSVTVAESTSPRGGNMSGMSVTVAESTSPRGNTPHPPNLMEEIMQDLTDLHNREIEERSDALTRVKQYATQPGAINSDQLTELLTESIGLKAWPELISLVAKSQKDAQAFWAIRALVSDLWPNISIQQRNQRIAYGLTLAGHIQLLAKNNQSPSRYLSSNIRPFLQSGNIPNEHNTQTFADEKLQEIQSFKQKEGVNDKEKIFELVETVKWLSHSGQRYRVIQDLASTCSNFASAEHDWDQLKYAVYGLLRYTSVQYRQEFTDSDREKLRQAIDRAY